MSNNNDKSANAGRSVFIREATRLRFEIEHADEIKAVTRIKVLVKESIKHLNKQENGGHGIVGDYPEKIETAMLEALAKSQYNEVLDPEDTHYRPTLEKAIKTAILENWKPSYNIFNPGNTISTEGAQKAASKVETIVKEEAIRRDVILFGKNVENIGPKKPINRDRLIHFVGTLQKDVAEANQTLLKDTLDGINKGTVYHENLAKLRQLNPEKFDRNMAGWKTVHPKEKQHIR